MDSFKSQVVSIAKQRKKEAQQPIENFSDESMEIEKNVYAHIDAIFPVAEISAIAPSSGKDIELEKGNPFKSLKEYLSNLISGGSLKSVVAFASIPLVLVGILAYQINSKNLPGLPVVPESLLNQGLAEYIDEPNGSVSKAFGEHPVSDNRRAFEAGVALADIDVIDNDESEAAAVVASRFGLLVDKTDVDRDLAFLLENVNGYASDENARHWMTHGYAVEIVNLSASRALDDMSTQIATDALQYYSEVTTVSFENIQHDLPIKSLENHSYLVDNASVTLTTPEEISVIVEKTRQMKLLVK